MSWGDPYDKFYKDDEGERRQEVSHEGLTPGAWVRYGHPQKDTVQGPLNAWSGPDLKSDLMPVRAGTGIILSVDCESDPAYDWLFLLFTFDAETRFCWLPSHLVVQLNDETAGAT